MVRWCPIREERVTMTRGGVRPCHAYGEGCHRGRGGGGWWGVGVSG